MGYSRDKWTNSSAFKAMHSSMVYQFTNKTRGGDQQYELVRDEFIRVDYSNLTVVQLHPYKCEIGCSSLFQPVEAAAEALLL